MGRLLQENYYAGEKWKYVVTMDEFYLDLYELNKKNRFTTKKREK